MRHVTDQKLPKKCIVLPLSKFTIYDVHIAFSNLGFKYAGTQSSYECWRSNQQALENKIIEDKCNSMCPGSKTEQCGGYLRASVYHTGYRSKFFRVVKGIPFLVRVY